MIQKVICFLERRLISSTIAANIINFGLALFRNYIGFHIHCESWFYTTYVWTAQAWSKVNSMIAWCKWLSYYVPSISYNLRWSTLHYPKYSVIRKYDLKWFCGLNSVFKEIIISIFFIIYLFFELDQDELRKYLDVVIKEVKKGERTPDLWFKVNNRRTNISNARITFAIL